MRHRFVIALCLIVVLAVSAFATVTQSNPVLEKAFTVRGEPMPVWIILTAPQPNPPVDSYYFSLLPKASQLRRHLNNSRPDATDRPIDPMLVSRIASTGATIRQTSRYLHAISVNATRKQVASLAQLDFVVGIEPVAKSKLLTEKSFSVKQKSILPSTIHHSPSTVASIDELDSLDYGPSIYQLEQINVLPLHQQGYTGRGVIGGILDSGFRWYHSCFDSMTILAQHDYVFNDNETANQLSDTAIAWDHGTATLSCIVGASSGNMFGAAYNATMILGKTEDVRSETAIEEDDYVAGLEWCDSLGAKGVSTSLGYIDWYTWQDMNGHTALCTQGILETVTIGIILFLPLMPILAYRSVRLTAPIPSPISAVVGRPMMAESNPMFARADGRLIVHGVWTTIAIGGYTALRSPRRWLPVRVFCCGKNIPTGRR